MERGIAILAGAGVLLLAVGSLQAAVITSDDFESYTADATLHGQGGWTYDPDYGTDPNSQYSSSPDEAWVIDTSDTGSPGLRLTYTSGDGSIDLSGGDRCLRLTKHYDDPDDPNDHVTKRTHVAAYRDSFDYPADPNEMDTEVYIGFMIRAPSPVGNSDNAALQLQVPDYLDRWEKSTTIGEVSYNVSGVGWQHGKGGWIHNSTSWAYPYYDTSVKDDNTHFIVACLKKDWHWHADPNDDVENDRKFFTKLEVWIDPDAGDSGSPDGVSMFLEGKAMQASYVDVVTWMVENGMDEGDYIYMDNLVIGENWGEVIPEPTTLILLGLGGAALLRKRR